MAKDKSQRNKEYQERKKAKLKDLEEQNDHLAKYISYLIEEHKSEIRELHRQHGENMNELIAKNGELAAGLERSQAKVKEYMNDHHYRRSRGNELSRLSKQKKKEQEADEQ